MQSLWRFPVKSMQGESVERVVVDGRGVVGDRGWAVIDPNAGKVLSAKRWGRLLEASARFATAGGSGTGAGPAGPDAGAAIVVTLPDGSEHEAGDPATDAALSTWLDHEVVLGTPPTGPGLPYELPTEAWDDTSDLWEFPGPPDGPFVDLAAAHVLTDASLRAAAALYPDGQWDVRRFRPTAFVHSDGDGFVEDSWVGSPLSLGDVTLNPFMPTVRCAMPTRAQPGGLDSDPEIARTLQREHGLNLGVYCGVQTPGPIAVGDPVTTS